jgi:Co/Zn/Cd efflux system component
VDQNARKIVLMVAVMLALFFVELVWGTLIENLALYAAGTQ